MKKKSKAEVMYTIPDHKMVEVQLHGKTVPVDEDIVEIVQMLNQFPGVCTLNSCQGGQGGYAYVQFGGPGALALIPTLSACILQLRQSWFGEYEVAKAMCQPITRMSIQLSVDDYGLNLRWWDDSTDCVKWMLEDILKAKGSMPACVDKEDLFKNHYGNKDCNCIQLTPGDVIFNGYPPLTDDHGKA